MRVVASFELFVDGSDDVRKKIVRVYSIVLFTLSISHRPSNYKNLHNEFIRYLIN